MSRLFSCRAIAADSLRSAFVRCLTTAAALVISAAAAPLLAQEDKLSGDDKTNQPAGKEVNLTQVRKELRKLDSDQLTDRDQAEKAIIEMGPTVLSFLPEISANTSGEMKIRLQRIRDALQKSDIKVFFEPALVTLAGKMSAADAIKKISEQTANNVVLENEGSQANVEVELKADKTPFWEVMESLMTQADLRINAFSTMDGLVLMNDRDDMGFPGPEPAFDGPFRIEPISTHSTLPYRSTLPGQLEISLQMTWEPRLAPVFIQIPMETMKGETDDGNAILASTPTAAPEIPVNTSNSSVQLDLQFNRPPRSSRKLNKLTGEVVVAVPSEKHKYVFEKFASGGRQTEKYGEVTVTLEGTRRNGAVYEMRVLTEFKNSQGALDSFRGWILSNRAYLVDKEDNRQENVGLQTYTVGPESVGVAFLFQINGNPNDYRLVYESPGMITRQKVSFELKNIDLP
ncbi:MAG: hypothetical protein U0892_03355 [Pirellulales bacterium]